MCDNVLVNEPCQPVAPGSPALSDPQIFDLLGQVDGWSIVGGRLERVFRFEDHYQAIAFVNAVAWVSHREDHHPEMVIAYDKVSVRYRTHSIDGLSRNDFLCAAKLDHLVE